MNPLTHIYIGVKVVDFESYTQDEKDLFIVGCIIPDVAEVGLADSVSTHVNTQSFAERFPEFCLFGTGITLHGEFPRGLDYFAHNVNGYVEKLREDLLPLTIRYRSALGNISPFEACHYLAEFVFDHILASKHPDIVEMLLASLKNPKVLQAINAFSKFFHVKDRDLNRIIKLCNSPHILKYFRNFKTLKGTASNWRQFIFFKKLRDSEKPQFRKKFTSLASSSFRFLRSTAHKRDLNNLFSECRVVIEPTMDTFVKHVTPNLKRLAISCKQ